MRAFSFTRGHFRSRDKDGGYTNRSALAENPIVYANVMALCFIEPELLQIEVLHCRNSYFWTLFCSCDLDLDPMTFIYKHNPYSLEIYRMCKYKLITSRIPKVIVWQTNRQTRPKLYTTLFRGRSIMFEIGTSTAEMFKSRCFGPQVIWWLIYSFHLEGK